MTCVCVLGGGGRMVISRNANVSYPCRLEMSMSLSNSRNVHVACHYTYFETVMSLSNILQVNFKKCSLSPPVVCRI